MTNDIFKLLEGLNTEDSSVKLNDRVVLIDGFNLFMRNFAKINHLNQSGDHIGGLGGFLSSLGFLIKELQPTCIYIIFDGVGSSVNRKNLVPEYKSGRTRLKLTKKNIFNTFEEESDSKASQITRLIHYLKCLPVKVISIDRTEADDVIAYLSDKFSKSFIVSSDNDFFQLVNENISVYRPQEKVLYYPQSVKEKYGVEAANYLVYKTLVGDSSDQIKGIQDLGPKTLFQKFPTIKDEILSLEDILKISEENYQKHIIYSRILFEEQKLRDTYKIMDLKNPLLGDDDKIFIDNVVNEKLNELNIEGFLRLYHEDGLLHTIRNVDSWVRSNFNFLNTLGKYDT